MFFIKQNVFGHAIIYVITKHLMEVVVMKKRNSWFRLDNAAKVFPPTSTKRDPKVFRFACELVDIVDPEYLQKALDETLNLFPGFQTVLKQGVFWYFLETTEMKPIVKKETLPVCTSLYDGNNKSLLFRVTHYKKRINLEVYHALTDGTGAMEFLKVLVHFYIVNKYLKDEVPTLQYDATNAEKMDDSFMKYYDDKKIKASLANNFAYQFKGEKLSQNQLMVMEGYLQTKQLLALAHKYKTTVTTLLTSIYIMAIAEDMGYKDRKKPIVITIPVNLRKYFSSATARNFFSVVNISYIVSDNIKLENVISNVKENLTHQLETDYIESQMNKFAALEHNFLVKFIPLFIKNFILKTSAFIIDKESTCSLSNVGKVDLPEEFAPYIKRFSVFISTAKQQMCVCSYNDELTIGFTSSFASTNVAKTFFRALTGLELDVTISTNLTE